MNGQLQLNFYLFYCLLDKVSRLFHSKINFLGTNNLKAFIKKKKVTISDWISWNMNFDFRIKHYGIMILVFRFSIMETFQVKLYEIYVSNTILEYLIQNIVIEYLIQNILYNFNLDYTI